MNPMINDRSEKMPGRSEYMTGDASDSEGDYRTSGEMRRYDARTLTAEEDAEKALLAAKTKSTIPKTSRKEKWRGSRRGERDQLILEEGARSSIESSANSSEVDLRLGGAHNELTYAPPRTRKVLVIAVVAVVLLAFFAFAYGACRASDSVVPPPAAYVPRVLSNGTHDFAPTTILISLDGFRADFLHRNITPNLKKMMQQGTSPRYMLPSFPSLTFPNHFTLVTGMYPESHGIVGNNFYDPVMQKQFTYANKELSMKPEYWNAEPLWETAELKGVRTAIHMWPGSEAHIGKLEPTYVDKYNNAENLANKVDRLLHWLDLPGPKDPGASASTPRPQLLAAYVPDIDKDGHAFGPNSTYIRSTIREVDGMIGSLFAGLEERNLSSVVSVVVVSDHGMATTSNTRLIQLEDLVDTALIEHTDGWPLYGLRPYNQSETKLDEIYQGLLSKSQEPQYKGKFDVYLRRTMPERWHFSQNNRIAPLWIVPKAGYAIVQKHEFDLSVALDRGDVYAPAGLHGYDHEHPLMRAIFLAKGPAFPHPEGSSVAPFQNIEVYNIICDSLGIEPRPNNGTLRLPLKATGLHDLDSIQDIPDDPPPIDHVANMLLPPTVPEPQTSSQSFNPDPPARVSEKEQTATKTGDETTSWRQWLNDKFEKIKGWATDLFGAHKKIQDKASEGS